MKTVITLTLMEALSRKEKAYLAQMLADALDDFRKARGPDAESYMLRRVKEGSIMQTDVDQWAYKIEEVKTRVALAEKLHNSALAAEIKESA